MLAAAEKLAWTAEDDARCEREEIERHLKLASDVDLAREMKARGLLGQVAGDNSVNSAEDEKQNTDKGKEGSGRRGAVPAAQSGGT